MIFFRVSYVICYLFIYLYVHSQDSLQKIKYFDQNFDINEISVSQFYGIEKQTGKKHFIATLYSPKRVKVATVNYYGKEKIKKDGPFVAFYSNGEMQFMGNYEKNFLRGDWTSWYPNKQTCDSGLLKSDVPDGTWKSWYSNGKPRLMVQFSARRLQMTKEEIRRIYRPFRVNFIPPFFTSITNTKRYLTYYEFQYNQLLEAIQPPEIIWSRVKYPIKTRVDFNTMAENERYLPPFSECLVHGLYKSYFPDGTLKDSGYYNNGIKTGVWEERKNDDVTRAVGYYKKGIKRGEWRYYNREGEVLSVIRYNWLGEPKERVKIKN